MELFNDLLYGQVWEDERLVASLLMTEKAAPTFLCIASAGELVTHLAMQGANVVAVDTSKAQLALSALKWESRCLPPEERRALLGLVPRDQLIHDASVRRELVERIISFSLEHPMAGSWASDLGTSLLSIDSFHDDWRKLVDAPWGPIGAAKVARGMRMIRKPVLAAIVGKKLLATVFAAQTREEREACVANMKKRLGWRALFGVLRTPLAALGGLRRAEAAKIRGLDKVEDEYIRAVTEVPLRENRCISWFARRQLDESAFPLWASRNESVGSIAWVHGDIGELVTAMPNGVFDGIYLSNVPDYLPEALDLFEGSLGRCKRYAPVIALRQHGAKDWISPLSSLRNASVTNLHTLPQWRYEQTAAYAGGVLVRA